MSKHTPGPWKLITQKPYGHPSCVHKILGANGQSVAETEVLNSKTAEVDLANATLIASSPDLCALAEAFEAVIKSAGHNLCSTATETERTAFISGILSAWNTHYPALDKARGK